MRPLIWFLGVIATIASPAAAVEFLGVDLCEGSLSTAIVLPAGSPLTVESVEIGSRGDLVILLASANGDALEHVDDLMERFTGGRGTGTSKELQWSGRKITAYGKEVTAKYVALAVSTSDTCDAVDDSSAAAERQSRETDEAPSADPTGTGHGGADETPTAAVAAAAAREPDEPPEAASDFELLGNLDHAAGPEGWVDVMGVVANHTTRDLQLATFDLAFFDSSGELICVDTISVSILKAGQRRAFRDSMRCAEYRAEAVGDVDLQFAGGY
jgi:hypothetical protein